MTDQPWMEDACSLVDAFRAGTISPTEALDASLTAIAASSLNAVSFIDEEQARATAKAADAPSPDDRPKKAEPIHWKLDPQPHGFYAVDAVLSQDGKPILTKRTSLAVTLGMGRCWAQLGQ